MRVLVTGAAGFVGRHVVSLLALHHQVVATDRDCSGLHGRGAAATIEGDLSDRALRRAALGRVEAVIHMAAIPDGAAEEDPRAAQQVNVETSMALASEAAALKRGVPFVFASSIAVFGRALSASIDDATPLAPTLLYGAHKAMVETWLTTLARRGELAAISLRLSGIVARPRALSGMNSAFMSNVFHAAALGRHIELPVSPEATMWLTYVAKVAEDLARGLSAAKSELPPSRAVTLPPLRVRMDELVAEICRQRSAAPDLFRYAPDADLEQDFGQQPPLTTPVAERLGFSHNGDLEQLVSSACATLN